MLSAVHHPTHTWPATAASAGEKKAKKERPMYLKDVLYKQAVEGGADDSSGAALHLCCSLLYPLLACLLLYRWLRGSC